jgi:hypothetical protein
MATKNRIFDSILDHGYPYEDGYEKKSAQAMVFGGYRLSLDGHEKSCAHDPCSNIKP